MYGMFWIVCSNRTKKNRTKKFKESRKINVRMTVAILSFVQLGPSLFHFISAYLLSMLEMFNEA